MVLELSLGHLLHGFNNLGLEDEFWNHLWSIAGLDNSLLLHALQALDCRQGWFLLHRELLVF